MDPLAATATVAGALAVAYALACWIKPFRPCWLCGGLGVRGRTLLSRRLRRCRWCRGTGLRLRLGRRLFNRANRLHDDGTRAPARVR